MPRVNRRRLVVSVGVMTLMLGAAYLGVIWHYADVLNERGLRVDRERKYEVEVVAIDGGTITLRPPDSDHQHISDVIGLDWEGGYARADGIIEERGDLVVRGFELAAGALEAGDTVRYDGDAYIDDPLAALGIEYEAVGFDGPLGPLSAWFVDGSGDTWVVYVHGKGADRGQGLRLLEIVADTGMPSLLISYRNHEGSPDDPSGRYQYGLTEWEDLEAAARYALANGAESVVLAGWSMGGAIVVNFMLESQLAERVDALILDAPMLDLEATVDWGAKQRRLPYFLTAGAKWLSDARFGIDWAGMDYLGRVDRLQVPVLLIHGGLDDTAPVRTSRAFAEARPDIVTYVEFTGADHTAAWNVDPAAYEAAVRAFLSE